MHEADKNAMMKQYCMGTNILLEIIAYSDDFINKQWILKSILESFLLASNAHSLITIFWQIDIINLLMCPCLNLVIL